MQAVAAELSGYAGKFRFLARNQLIASLFASFLRARQFFRFVRVAGSE